MKNTRHAAKAALKPNGKPAAKSPSSNTAGTNPPATTPTAKPATVAAPAAAVSAPAAAPAAAGAALTTIDVKLDVGFGNAVFLRGQGAGLTWERGLPLVCVDSQTWRWSGVAKDPITFKVLINDKIWSAGEDLKIAPGEKVELAPAFA